MMGNKGYIPEGLWRSQGPGGCPSRIGAIQSLSSNCFLHNLFCNACGPPISTKALHVRSHTPAGTPRLPWAAHTFHAHSLTHFIGQAQVPETQGLPCTGTNPHSEPFHIQVHANTKLQIIGLTLSAWPGTSRLSHWKKRFLGLFGRTFLLCLCLSSTVVHLKNKHPKGKKSCLQGCPVAEGGQEQLSTESHRLRYAPSVLPPHTCPCTGLEKN